MRVRQERVKAIQRKGTSKFKSSGELFKGSPELLDKEKESKVNKSKGKGVYHTHTPDPMSEKIGIEKMRGLVPNLLPNLLREKKRTKVRKPSKGRTTKSLVEIDNEAIHTAWVQFLAHHRLGGLTKRQQEKQVALMSRPVPNPIPNP